ncbi:hypothetical protein EYR38_003642 [Pleurotus pulmonarius]|nr:hypothetical protein EYR38_003642 [Pleurotus pulmonarius]
MTPQTNPVDPDATPRPNRTRPTRTRIAVIQYPRNASNTSPTREAPVKPQVARSSGEDSIVFKALLLKLPGVPDAILRPAIAVAQYLIYDDTTTRKFPNTSSVGGSAPVPDSIVFKLYRDPDNAVAAVEFKTHVVLGADWFDAMDKLLACAQNSPVSGAAAKFHWPDREDTEFDKATLVLLQVWGQMRNWNVQYGILSSYEHTYFLFKPQAVSDTLYITNGFKPDNSDLLPATVSFLALALGHYSLSDVELPEPNIEHWDRASVANFQSTGLVPSTYPPLAQAAAANVRRRR